MAEVTIDGDTVGGLSALTDPDLATLRAAVLGEEGRRATVAQSLEQVEQIAARYAEATADQPAEPYAAPTGAHDAYGPGRKIVWTDGHTYRNDSGQWLSHSPEEYPRGWTCLDCPEPEPDPDTGVLPWTDKGSPSYKTGDLRTWPDGSSTVYRCRQDHTAHEGAGFNPSVASLWEIAT